MLLGQVEEDEDEDDVPYREEIGWREALGFIVMSVILKTYPMSQSMKNDTSVRTGIDPQRRKYTVLSPSPGKLPSTVAIAGSIDWVDSE